MTNVLTLTTPGEFISTLGMLLRDQPRGTVALVDDFCVAWWNGKRPVFAYLRDDRADTIDEEFDPIDCEWQEWRNRAEHWLRSPVFSVRYCAQILPWLANSAAERGGAT